MTEYQLLDVFNSYLNTTIAFFVSYISATSAFLAVAYVVGKKLPSFVARLVVTLYTLTAVLFVITFQRNWAALITIREQMSDIQMTWFPAVYEPHIFLSVPMWIGVVVMTLLYVGSVWYFLSVRRSDD
jgi:hypothetical protein